MIRTLCTLVATVALCSLFAGCGGGADMSDAPKGGQRRPAPSEVQKPAGPGEQGVISSDNAAPQQPGAGGKSEDGGE